MRPTVSNRISQELVGDLDRIYQEFKCQRRVEDINTFWEEYQARRPDQSARDSKSGDFKKKKEETVFVGDNQCQRRGQDKKEDSIVPGSGKDLDEINYYIGKSMVKMI
ncbi:hypothetical protein PPACK8108_LOCUS10972 [Phakopsora pachyrhizi]|uniref:Uncharacterized protein n=1 Tax=Phakopsora pachyrhizi TaxID=170000 RepID=A0AAV0AZ76_PHAPC|nr:hypothetical protein PPACK8108_LOCUS10972 [Phakopsora pachyrhizi]